MKDTTHQLFDRAADAIEASDILLTNDKVDIAAGRAYYAMFYTAEALLNEKGIQFGKHGNVIAAYGQHFAKTKELDPSFTAGCLPHLIKGKLGTMPLTRMWKRMWSFK